VTLCEKFIYILILRKMSIFKREKTNFFGKAKKRKLLLSRIKKQMDNYCVFPAILGMRLSAPFSKKNPHTKPVE
jgi:hypothetical protein